MPPPTGGRAHADYAEEHRTAIGRYLRLKELGSPAGGHSRAAASPHGRTVSGGGRHYAHRSAGLACLRYGG